MEKIKLHFTPSDFELEIDGLNIEVAQSAIPDQDLSESEILRRAIANADRDLEAFARNANKPLVIVNDRQRPTPTAKILPYIEPVIAKDPLFIVACGAHEAPKEVELKAIFGEAWEGVKSRLFIHRAKTDPTVKLFTSRDGFDFELNQIIESSDSIVTINSVEPHYFAGFTGGRKSFLPGISSYNTIQENHKFSLLPGSKTFALEGNPVHENMMELSDYIAKNRDIYSIQVVLHPISGKIFSAYAGSINSAFYKAVEDGRKLYGAPISNKADIVITVATSPQDARLYQSFKALDNGSVALNENGILILLASCHEGIGNADFVANVSRFKSPNDVLQSKEFTLENYKLGYQRMLRLARWGANGNLWIVSNMRDDEARMVFFRPFKKLDQAIEEALSIKGKDARIVLIPNGILTVPYISAIAA